MKHTSTIALLAAGLLSTGGLAACGGGDDFTATDAAGLAAVLDGAASDDSPMKGLITAEMFTDADVEEFNGIAEEACSELSASGMSADDVDEFTDGVLDGAEGMEEFLDVEELLVGLVDATCPSNTQTVRDAFAS